MSYYHQPASWHSGHALDSLDLGPEFEPRRSHLILLAFRAICHDTDTLPQARLGYTGMYLLCLSNGTAPCTVDPDTCLIKVILLKHDTGTGTFASASRAKDN